MHHIPFSYKGALPLHILASHPAINLKILKFQLKANSGYFTMCHSFMMKAGTLTVFPLSRPN